MTPDLRTEPLRTYQQRYIDRHAFDVAHYLMWEPRMGKTRAEAHALQRCIEAGAKRTLIVGPQKPLALAWTDELAALGIKHVPLHTGAIRERAETLQRLIDTPTDEHIAITVNYEVLEEFLPCWRCNHSFLSHNKDKAPRCSAKRNGEPCDCDQYMSTPRSTRLVRLSDLLEAWAPQNIDVDEAHLIKSAGAQRTNALRILGRKAIRRRMLSGTPDPQGSIDFYAQYVFLDPTIFGTTKAGFLKEYCDVNPFTHHIESYKNEDALLAKVFSIASRERARDYFAEIPETEVVRDIRWSAESRALYDELAHEHVLNLDGLRVDGTHKLTRLLRHLQLCAGFLTDDGSRKVAYTYESKIEALLEDLAEPLNAGQAVVVSYLFTPAGHALVEAIGKRYGREIVTIVNGEVGERDAEIRLRLFDVRSANAQSPIRVLVVQEGSGAEGISLARARHLFFHSWSMNAAKHYQMRKRIWNPGDPSFYTYFQMKNSADGFARKIVTDKHMRSVMERHGFDFTFALQGEYVPGTLSA